MAVAKCPSEDDEKRLMAAVSTIMLTFVFAVLVVLSFAQADGNRAHVLLSIDRIRPVRQESSESMSKADPRATSETYR